MLQPSYWNKPELVSGGGEMKGSLLSELFKNFLFICMMSVWACVFHSSDVEVRGPHCGVVLSHH